MELQEAEIRDLPCVVTMFRSTVFTQGPQLKLIEETPIPKTRRSYNLHSLKAPFRLAHHSLHSFVDAEK